MIGELRIGAPVFTSDGQRAGELERIVVTSEASDDPAASSEHHITNLVVNPGFRDLGDLLQPGSVEKPRARTVPVGLATSVAEDAVRLSCDAKAFAALPLFERREYAAAEAGSSGRGFRWGDLINYTAAAFGLGAAPYMAESESTAFNEAAGSASLPARTPVWRADPHERLGQIERALVESGSERVTGFALRRDRMDEELVMLPAGAISSIEDGVVYADLSDDEVDALEPFEEE